MPADGTYKPAPAQVGFGDESFDINAGGAPLPGSDASLSSSTTLGFGLGYYFTDSFSVMGLVGIPPTTEATGEGVLAGLTLGEVTYGPVILVGNYHVPTKGRFKPFFGAGIVYNHIFDTEDNGITGLKVENSWGGVLRVGFDYEIDDNWGAFTSVNKLFLDSEFSGAAPAFGGAPVTAKASLDPLIIHAGISYRF